MLAFFRVFAFYAATAALLIWGLFALGWADALELPGFESETRAKPSPPAIIATRPWEEPAAMPVPKNAPQRAEFVPPSEQARVTEIQQGARATQQTAPPAPPATRPPEPPAQVMPAPLPPPPRTEPVRQPEPPRAEPPKQVQAEPPRPEPKPPVRADVPAPTEPAKPEPPRPVAQIDQPRVVQPQPPPLPPVPPAAAPAPLPKIAEAVPATRPPVISEPPAAPRAAPVMPAQPPTPPPAARWAPVRRVAGFGIDALVDKLDEVKPGTGDVPCVVLGNLTFKAGTAAPQSATRTELELIAKVLNAQTEHRLEIGSRLGPGRPMASDARLRADRVRFVRESLIAMGVAQGRLLAEPDGAYERVTDDIARTGSGRRQSMGICVHA